MTVDSPFSYLASAELTDVGRRRKNNEDSMISLPEAGVFCVADGMGGVQGGEVASKAAVDALRKTFTESPDKAFAVTADAAAKLVERALNEASHWIKDRAEGLGVTGTGSTAVVLVFDRVTPSQGLALHAGDSRAYRLRGDKLVQLTVDHSVAAAAGLPDDSSLPAMFRGVITRAVGLDHRVEIEATAFDVAPNDIFLLCSDGLSKMVSDRKLQKLLRKHHGDPLSDIAKLLVSEALEAGGEDNVSVVLIRVAAELPKGPTMDVPPETLALEQVELVPPAPAAPLSHEDHDATGQTADTGAHTAHTLADAGDQTPSDGGAVAGVTPTTPTQNPTPATARRQMGARPSPSSRWLWWTLGVIGAACAGTFGYMALQDHLEKQERDIPPKPAMPVVSGGSTSAVESTASDHAASADLHGAHE